MKRNDYRARVKQMSDDELRRYIDRITTHMLATGEHLNRLLYAVDHAEKRGLQL